LPRNADIFCKNLTGKRAAIQQKAATEAGAKNVLAKNFRRKNIYQ